VGDGGQGWAGLGSAAGAGRGSEADGAAVAGLRGESPSVST